MIGSGAEGYNASFRDVTKTYNPANTHFDVWYLIINSGVLADLEEKDRTALEEAASEFEVARWVVAEEDQGKNEQELVAAGTTIVDLVDAELAAMVSKVQAEVWPEILNDVGADWEQGNLDKATN